MVLRFCLFVDAQYNQLNDLVLISCMKASIRDFYQSTEVPEIEDVLELKRVEPPYKPNRWAELIHILARTHSWDSIKGH